jgi:hypothetical protein
MIYCMKEAKAGGGATPRRKKRSNGTPNILKKRLMNVWQILKKNFLKN